MPETTALALTNGALAESLPVPIFPKRPKRRFSIDPEIVVESVLRRVQAIASDTFLAGDGQSAGWLDQRTLRYAKLRGWLPEKSHPWRDCSNVHLPLMMQHSLRSTAGLSNPAMSLRPLMGAKATNKVNAERELKVAQLLDYQMFAEPGPALAERRLSNFILGAWEDGNAVAFTDWVRAEGSVYRLEHLPPIPEGMAPAEYLDREFARLFPGFVGAELPPLPDDDSPPVNNVFMITYRRGQRKLEAEAVVFEDEDDGTLTVELRYDATLYDGPVYTVLPITSVIVPTRVDNLQPPFPENPTGAPFCGFRWKYRVDEIRRRKESGEFNYLNKEGLDKILAMARAGAGLPVTRPDDALEKQKDAIEGREHRGVDGTYEEDIGHVEVGFIWLFDRWDVRGTGQSEDVYWLIAEDAKVLCEGRCLTERWPATRPYRPLAELCLFPVKDRWYGISGLELMESLYDFIKGVMDQAIDGWTMGTLGWFLYGASSKFTADIIGVSPGQGIPVPGNPRESVLFPNLPQRDVTGALGIVGMSMQMLDQLMMQGPLQRGQVPTGKSSALRTTGTTMALLQQGDVRADQLLLRFFNGLAQIYGNFHRMNRQFLPEGKEFRVVGWDGEQERGYVKIGSVTDIDVDVDFEFKPEFLSSNREVQAQALSQILMLMMQPMAFQMGITDPNLVHRTVKKYARAMLLDPRDHFKAPTPNNAPGIFAEEAVNMAISGQPIYGQPIEGAGVHFAKLSRFVNSDAAAVLSAHPLSIGIFRAWWQQVADMAQQEQMAQQAGQMAEAVKGQQMGQGALPVTAGQEPPAGTGEMMPQADAMATEAAGGMV